MTQTEFNQTEIGDIFGVNRATVNAWDKRQCPSTGTGRDKRYNLKQVVEWFIKDKAPRENQTEKSKLILQKIEAETRLIQLKADELEGVLVNAFDIEQQLKNEFTLIRAKLMNLPSSMAAQVVLMDEPAEIQKALSDEIALILENITNAD